MQSMLSAQVNRHDRALEPLCVPTNRAVAEPQAAPPRTCAPGADIAGWWPVL